MLQLGLEAGERRALVLALARRGFLEDRCRAGPHSDWRRVAASAMAKGRRSVEKWTKGVLKQGAAWALASWLVAGGFRLELGR
jgi:hypothetical protein